MPLQGTALRDFGSEVTVRGGRSMAPDAQSHAERMTTKPRILCIDDQVANLRICTALLEQFGCETISAQDHQSALYVIAETPLDLVIIDYHLAYGETGDAVAHDVRALRPRLPLIMFTGDSRLPDHVRSCVDAVLFKGTTGPGELLDMIAKLVPEVELRAQLPQTADRPPTYRRGPKLVSPSPPGRSQPEPLTRRAGR